jgi:hypothetical protein
VPFPRNYKTYEDHVQKKIYGIFLFFYSYSAFFFLSWIHFLLRLILERACVHDDGVNHVAPESCPCILSIIAISFLFLFTHQRFSYIALFVYAFIFPHLLLFTFYFFLLFSIFCFCMTRFI